MRARVVRRAVAMVALATSLAACADDGPSGMQEPDSTTTTREAFSADGPRAAFQAYKDAIVRHDGREAVRHLAPATMAYFARMRDLALDASEAELVRIRMVEQLTVVSMRARIDAERVRTADVDSLVAEAIDLGLVGADVAAFDVGEVVGSGDQATAPMVKDGVRAGSRIVFQRVDGQWRVDLQPLLATAEQLLQRAVENPPTEPKVFVEQLLARRVGAEAAQRAWQPLGR